MTKNTFQYSLVVVTYNSAETINKCLASVLNPAEIIIVDLGSRDQTLSMVQKYQAQIFKHPRVDFVEPVRNFAIQKAKSDWVLLLDPDEYLSSNLAAKINSLSGSELNQVDAFYFSRLNFIFGHAMQQTGWWPDYQLRLFRKVKVFWPKEIHQMPVVEGKSKYLAVDKNLAIIHQNYNTLDQYLEKTIRYTSAEIVDAKNNKKLKNADQSINSGDFINTFFAEFYSRFFANKGVEENLHGEALSLLQSYYQLLVKLRVWESTKFKPDTSANLIETVIDQQIKNLHYWRADYYCHRSKGISNIYWRLRRKIRI